MIHAIGLPAPAQDSATRSNQAKPAAPAAIPGKPRGSALAFRLMPRCCGRRIVSLPPGARPLRRDRSFPRESGRRRRSAVGAAPITSRMIASRSPAARSRKRSRSSSERDDCPWSGSPCPERRALAHQLRHMGGQRRCAVACRNEPLGGVVTIAQQPVGQICQRIAFRHPQPKDRNPRHAGTMLGSRRARATPGAAPSRVGWASAHPVSMRERSMSAGASG